MSGVNSQGPGSDIAGKLADLGRFCQLGDIQIVDDLDNPGYVLITFNRTAHGNASVGFSVDRTGVDPNLYIVTNPGQHGAIKFLCDNGLLFPVFTTTQRDAITPVTAGLVIYNTTISRLQYYDGSTSSWREVKMERRSDMTYSASMTPSLAAGNWFRAIATNGTAFTINAPTSGVSINGLEITITISNTSGGALGAITFAAGYHLAGAFTAPATGFQRSVTFKSDGTNWFEMYRTAADVAN